MSQTLKTILWIKFIVVVTMFALSFALDFWILWLPAQAGLKLFLWGKPLLVLAFIGLLNLLFHFPSRIPVPNIIPSVFLVLSFLVFVDLAYLIWHFYAILSPHLTFWAIYTILFAICTWNAHRYIRAFTVGIPD